MTVDPKVRALGLHLGTFGGGAVTMILFASSHSVDLYAIMDQVNVIVKEVGKLLALATPIATGAWQVWKATNKNTVVDAAAIPGTTIVTTPVIAAATPLQSNVVSSTEMKVEVK